MTMHQADTQRQLTPHWLVCLAMLLLLIIYNLICHFGSDGLRLNLDETQRVTIRTTLYAVTIGLFPLTNLVRHILLRLNQTMPGDKPAAQRYLTTIIVTQTMIEIVSLFGLLMFLLGDDFNTLYIFSVLGLLGIFLHKPKMTELEDIIQALNIKNTA